MENDMFVKVANVKDIPVSQMKEVQIHGKNICIANIDGKYYAIDNTCSHEGGPLADGKLEGYEVECPWHQSRFDMRNGEVKSPPADQPQSSYPIKVEADQIMLSLIIRGQETKQDGESTQMSEYQLLLQDRQSLASTDILTLKLSKKEKNDGKRFDYTAGQFAFFDIGGVINDAKGPIRHFTIASSPTEDFVMISTRIRDSPYKKRLNSLQNGTTVKVRGPQGKFTLHEDQSKIAVFLSGGIGVTPFRSMIKYATDKNLPLKIIMFDSNKNQQSILYKNDFDNCTVSNKNLKIIYTITDEEQANDKEWRLEKGRIDASLIKKYIDSAELENSVFYVCGPPTMLKAMRDLLEHDLRIPIDRIKIEEFTGY